MIFRAYAFQPKEPPTELQLWRVGDNPTDYGVHVWSQRSIEEAFGEYERRGNPIQLDVEHLGAEPPKGEPPPTAGYARLEIRSGAPWLVFDWSAYAVEQIRTGQRLALSPEYEVDTKTGEIVRLVRVSLVGDPATHNARWLASRYRAQKGNGMTPELMKKALDVIGAQDEKGALSLLTELLAQAAGAGVGASPEAPAEAAAPPAGDPAAAPPAPASEEEKMMRTAAEEEEPVAAARASRKSEPAPAAAPSAVDALAARIEGIEREAYLAKHGSRVTEGVRKFLATQPLSVVKGLLDASPEAPAAAASPKPATRGATAGARASRLAPAEKAQLDQLMGIKAKRIGGPKQLSDGRLVLATMRPSDFKRDAYQAFRASTFGPRED